MKFLNHRSLDNSRGSSTARPFARRNAGVSTFIMAFKYGASHDAAQLLRGPRWPTTLIPDIYIYIFICSPAPPSCYQPAATHASFKRRLESEDHVLMSEGMFLALNLYHEVHDAETRALHAELALDDLQR